MITEAWAVFWPPRSGDDIAVADWDSRTPLPGTTQIAIMTRQDYEALKARVAELEEAAKYCVEYEAVTAHQACEARIARGLVGRVFPDSKFILSDVQKDRKELLALVEARKRVALVVLED
jgi:hypothetical protein